MPAAAPAARTERPDRPRRTQAERTEQTRTALLDAAVEVLAEQGFVRASTTEIARRAGVSRGAQLHHFPSKADLVSAALDHVFAEREAEFRRRFAALPEADRTQTGAVSLLWEVSQSSAQDAVLELLVAARTDDELRPLARRVVREFERSVTEVFAEVLPDAAADPFVGHRVRVALSVLQAATLHHQLGLEEEAAELVDALALLADAFPLDADLLSSDPPAATATAETATTTATAGGTP